MAIVVRKDGAIKTVTRIYQKQGSTWKECLLVQFRRTLPGGTPELVTVFDRYLTPPTGVRGVSATFNSGQLAWNATPQATDYQVLRRPASTPSAAPTILPSPGTWTSELSLNAVGLAANSNYRFTVQARRIKADGEELISPESSAITLFTGYPAVTRTNPEWPGQRLVYVSPTGSGTWTSAYNWGANSGSPDVVQGYASAANRNAKGCVIYNNAFVNLRDNIWAVDPSYSDWTAVNFHSALIELVHRRSAPVSNTPEVRIRATYTNFSGEPPLIGGYGTFAAPTPNHDAENFAPAGLLDWVHYWCLHPIPTGDPSHHNGMVIFRSDGQGNATAGYNGYATFQGFVSGGSSWRIKLNISWSYTVPGAAAAWSTTSA